MRIVLPVHHFPPRYNAGAELYTFRLARWLLDAGHEVEVVCVEDAASGAPGLSATRDDYQGVTVWRLAFELGAAPDPFRWSYDNPDIKAWFEAYLGRYRPDLVHLQSGYLITAAPLEAAADLGIATAVTLHDYWFACPRITLMRGDGALCQAVPEDPAACAWCARLASRRYRLLDRTSRGLMGQAMMAFGSGEGRTAMAARRRHLQTALGRADAVVAPSRFLAELFANSVTADKLHILRIGIKCDLLQSTPAPPADGKLRLGYIGQIAAHKGVHVLVRAMQLLPERGRPVELTIYGDLQQHQGYSARLRISVGPDPRIRLAGRFDNSRITEVLAQCDVLVVPSIWFENSPLAILEAQAAGRPVLTSAMGGMAELVRDGVDGLQFQPGDERDLAEKIQRLRDEPELLDRLRGNVVAPASIDSEMERMLQIYRRAVERTPTAAHRPQAIPSTC